ncbi:uncharacterized protein [Onthophagus taurus]|uniref:uncharacterized protein n=1 Tax=Onthophagus taurus TaxID=166361 RepID=UPI0039BDBCEF
MVSVVPENWLKYLDGITFCFWPKMGIRKHIMKATSPECNWDQYRVHKLLEKPVTYVEALRYEKKKGQTDGETSDNAAVLLDTGKSSKRPHRKKKQKLDPGYAYGSSGENNFYANLNLQCFPKVPKITLNTQHIQQNTDISDVDTISSSSTIRMASPLITPEQTSSKGEKMDEINASGEIKSSLNNINKEIIILDNVNEENSENKFGKNYILLLVNIISLIYLI